jgi:cytochrome c
MKTKTSLLIAGSLLFALTGLVPAQAAVDEEAAQALLKKSDCFKCHAIDKKKDGPAYKEVAKKYKGKADAEDKLVKHVTLKPMIEIDGKKEEHKAIKSSDPAEIKNAVQFILTR